MEQTKKVLIITYYWPPSGGAGVQRWLKFAKYLPEFDIEPIILTVDPAYASYPQRDESLLNDVRSDLKVYKTKSFEPLNILSKLVGKQNVPYGGFTNVNKKSVFQIFLRFVRGNFFIPDPRKGWNKYAYKKAKEIITEYNIDTVITTSPPHSTQLIGLKLKKKLNVKWIADFRDPWTDIYYYKDLFHTGFVKEIEKKLEKKIIGSCDNLITVSNGVKEIFENKVKVNRISVIHNGYDNEDFNIKSNPSKDKFIITYIGTISENYNIQTFINPLKEVITKNPELHILLRFVGNVPKTVKNQLEEIIPKKNLEFIQYAPHHKAIEYLLSSTVLVLIIAYAKENKGLVSGKLFEYLASKKNIITIGPKNGDVEDIIKESKSGKVFQYTGEESLIEDYLEDLIKKWKINYKLDLIDSSCEKFSRRNQAKTLSDIIFQM